MSKKTTEEFIKECKNKYGNKYDYSKVKFKGNSKKIIIKCNDCNKEIIKTPRHFLYRGQGCQTKSCKNPIKRNNQKNLDRFIKKSKEIHNDKYDYSHLKKEDYNSKKVKIYCKRCKEFFNQRPSSHLAGSGHPVCSGRKTTKQFIKKSKDIHGTRYLYDKTIYIKNNQNVKIYCKIHKYYFEQKAEHHAKGHGCPKCNTSKGERIIINYLDKRKIVFVHQKTHNFLSKRIIFDFYLPKYKLFIEYDGRQHFVETNFFKEDLRQNIENDSFKNSFVFHKNENLLRICYVDIDNIEKILNDILKKKLKRNIYYSTKKIYDDLVLQHAL